MRIARLERRGRLVERGHDDVRGHDRLTPRPRSPLGTARAASSLVDVDDREARGASPARSRRGPGNASRTRRRLPPAARATNAATWRATSSAVGAERADADDGVRRVHVHVRDRREVQVDADRGEVRADRAPPPAASARRRRQRRARSCRGTSCRGRLEPRDVAALLVDRRSAGRRAPRGATRSGPELLPVADVAGEQADPAEPAFEPRAAPSPAPRSPSKPGKMQAAASRSSSTLIPA